MYFYITQDEKIEVNQVPCPDKMNPQAVELVDAAGNVWACCKYPPISQDMGKPASGYRQVPIRNK